MNTFYIPSEDAFAPDLDIEQLEQLISAEETRPMPTIETLYMTPEQFAATWMVVAWMRAKVEMARRDGTLLEVEVQSTAFGRYVMSLEVVSGR